ncbi:MAG: hypothetical protein NTW21_25455 [Verrucomicrobia bacterium]|nr:hypothetical protein [Verrucomicrobiota bacterium]
MRAHPNRNFLAIISATTQVAWVSCILAASAAAGENRCFLDDDAKMFVLTAGPKFEWIAKNPLGEACFASPAISRGRIFLRTLNHLHCIGTR